MIGKRVTVILFGSDRNLWRGGPLQIRVSDLFASGGPRNHLRGKDRRVHRGASAGAALRRRPDVRAHVRRPASSSRLAVHSASGLHPHSGAGRRRRPDPAADARARFAGNDGPSKRAGSAPTAGVAVCGARHRPRAGGVRATRRGRPDGVPQYRGEAARNRHRRRAAHVVCSCGPSRPRRSGVPAVRRRA